MPATALVLAAGRGERLRPLTDATPKPLLMVGGQSLIERHLRALAADGVHEVVINTAWLEEQFEPALGDGSALGLRLHYSREGRDHGGALETAGGIAKALPLLADAFWVVSGDVLLPGFRFEGAELRRFAEGSAWAQLWLVPNAPHHPQGDFGVDDQGLAVREGAPRLTWASVGLFKAGLFAGIAPGTRLPLRPLLERALDERRLAARHWPGPWVDVGSLQRLQQAEALLRGEAAPR
ncbi:MAG: nucleotidyltransferase family protein [Rubrivivax sp.]|nr:nucleotidyltransferase family protein [Rubrivivax sp.]